MKMSSRVNKLPPVDASLESASLGFGEQWTSESVVPPDTFTQAQVRAHIMTIIINMLMQVN
jgi:hypothetical protein